MANSNTLTARRKLVEEHMRAENAHDIAATMATLGRQPRYVLNGVSIDGHEAIRAAYEGIGLGNAAAFAQFTVEVTGLHTGEEAIVLEGMMSGTHVAEWQGVPRLGGHLISPCAPSSRLMRKKNWRVNASTSIAGCCSGSLAC